LQYAHDAAKTLNDLKRGKLSLLQVATYVKEAKDSLLEPA
jgi:hypothetical protein